MDLQQEIDHLNKEIAEKRKILAMNYQERERVGQRKDELFKSIKELQGIPNLSQKEAMLLDWMLNESDEMSSQWKCLHKEFNELSNELTEIKTQMKLLNERFLDLKTVYSVSMLNKMVESTDDTIRSMGLNFDSVDKMLNTHWKTIYGLHIDEAIQVLMNHAEESTCQLYSLYYQAILDQYQNTAETELQEYFARFFKSTVNTINRIDKHSDLAKLEYGSNVWISTFGSYKTRNAKKKIQESYDPQSKRRKKTTSDSLSTFNSSPADLNTANSPTARSSFKASPTFSSDAASTVSSQSLWFSNPLKLLSRKPDFMIKSKLHNLIHLIGAIKGKAAGQEEADDQLLAMAFPLNRDNSDRVNQSFGLTVAGENVTLYYIEQKKYCITRECVSRYCLTDSGNRVRLLTNCIQLYYIMSFLTKKMEVPKTNNYSDYMPVVFRRTCKLQFLRNEVNEYYSVLKVVDIHIFNEEPKTRLERLTRYYLLIMHDNQTCPIVNSLRCYEFQPSSDNKELFLDLRPVGIEPSLSKITASEADVKLFMRNVIEYLISIHLKGFVHSDLRLDNITFVGDRYLVIDYENIKDKCTFDKSGYCVIHSRPFNREKPYQCPTALVDFKLFEMILKDDICYETSNETILVVVRRVMAAIKEAQGAFLENPSVEFNADLVLNALD